MHAKLELSIIRAPITIQCLVKEFYLPLVLGLVSNQCMAVPNDLLMIILPPKLEVYIRHVNKMGSLVPIPN